MSEFKSRLQSIFNDVFTTPSNQNNKGDSHIIDLDNETMCALNLKLKRNMSGRLKINDQTLNDSTITGKRIETTNTYNGTNSNFITSQCNTNKLIRNSNMSKLLKSNSHTNLILFTPTRTHISTSKHKIKSSIRQLSKEITGTRTNEINDYYDRQVTTIKKETKNYLSKTSFLIEKENRQPMNSLYGNYKRNNDNPMKNDTKNHFFECGNKSSFLKCDPQREINEFKRKLNNTNSQRKTNYNYYF